VVRVRSDYMHIKVLISRITVIYSLLGPIDILISIVDDRF